MSEKDTSLLEVIRANDDERLLFKEKGILLRDAQIGDVVKIYTVPDSQHGTTSKFWRVKARALNGRVLVESIEDGNIIDAAEDASVVKKE